MGTDLYNLLLVGSYLVLGQSIKVIQLINKYITEYRMIVTNGTESN